MTVLLGVDIITVSQPDWRTSQVPMLTAMRATIARVRCAPGFGEPPAILADLKALGCETVILNIENTDSNGSMRDKAVRDLIARGWLNEAVTLGMWALVEFGNEPDHPDYGANSGNPGAQVADIEAAIAAIGQRSNVGFAASLPTRLGYAQAMAPVFAQCHALCPHLYGGSSLGDGAAGEQGAVLAWVLAHTSLPLFLSEVGIDDPAVPMATKAQRILDGLARLDQGRVKGACVFTISTDPAWSHYALDMAACEVFGARTITSPASNPVQSPTQYQAEMPVAPPKPAVQTVQSVLQSPGQTAPAHPLVPSAPADPFAPIPEFADTSERRFYPQTGHSLGLGFRAYWDAHGGLPIFGYPLSEEFEEGGRTVQYFERNVFEAWPENPPAYRVLLRRLGYEAAQAKGYVK